jgi:hypothetical protein
MPARPLPTEPAKVFAVWYQANDLATAFLPPCSAMSACTEGSRNESDRPWPARTAYSCHGIAERA